MLSEDKVKRCFDQRCHDLVRYYREHRLDEAQRELGAVIALSYILDVDIPADCLAVQLKLYECQVLISMSRLCSSTSELLSLAAAWRC